MRLITFIGALAISTAAIAQTSTKPATTQPSSPDLMLKQLLSPNRPQKVLQPVDYPPEVDQTSKTAIAPKADLQRLVREGTYMVNRMGRLTKTADGAFYELTFEADGSSMKDPPMLILPNRQLMLMESSVKATSSDLKFLVTGMVTEYNTRNYILLEKVVVVQDAGSLKPTKKQKQQDNDEIAR